LRDVQNTCYAFIMNLKSSQKGFSLTELLVVIAIIGILATIVLAAVNGSRTKGKDTTIKAQVEQARNEIEAVGAQTTGFVNYGNTLSSSNCPTSSSPPNPIFYTDPNLQNIIAKINSSNGYGSSKCAAGGPSSTAANTWAIASPLPSTGPGGQWWCMDSSGKSKLSTTGAPAPKGILAFIIRAITTKAVAAMGIGPNLGGGAGAATCP
jgi:prepilin-type N-terminal cleavage/methylation domain-containing protein